VLTERSSGPECRCPTDHQNWKTGAYHAGSPGAALVTSSTAHWLQVSCSCAQGVTRPASTVPDWRLSALDRHRPPITAIGWYLDVCHKKNTNASRWQEFFRRWTVTLELSACRITWQRHLTCTV